MANAKPDQWTIFVGSANFAVENNKYVDEALTWVTNQLKWRNILCPLRESKILFNLGNNKKRWKQSIPHGRKERTTRTFQIMPLK